MQKLFLILALFSFFSIESQNLDESNLVEDTSIAAKLYTKSFVNLNQGNEIFDKFPSSQNVKFYSSLLTCSYLLAFKEIDIQNVGEKRLIGIATQLYREGNPVYLIRGLDSSWEAKKKNENLEDDNHIVYISYGDCVNPTHLIKAADIVNKQTLLLIKQSSTK